MERTDPLAAEVTEILFSRPASAKPGARRPAASSHCSTSSPRLPSPLLTSISSPHS